MLPIAKKTLTLLVIFVTFRLTAQYILPIVFPFLLGLSLALLSEPMVSFLCKRGRIPRGFAAGIGVSMAFSCIALLVLLICAFLVRELGILAGIVPNLEQTARSGIGLLENWLIDLTNYAPDGVDALLRQNVTELFSDGTALLNRGVGYLLGLAGNLLSHIPDSALTLGTAVISGFMISAKLPRIKTWFFRLLPRQKWKPVFDALKRVKSAVTGWILAQFKLSGVTLLILSAGFALLRIPYGLLWALGTCLLDAFPVLGTGTILLPWALISFLQGNTPQAVGLLGIYTVVTLVRSTLEPKLVGQQLGLDPLVTLICLYAGYKLWGIGGMILAPLLTVTALQLLPGREDKL